MGQVYTPTNKTYSHLTFVNAIKNIIPNIYLEKDYDLSGMELSPEAAIINSHLNIANNISSIIQITNVDNTIYSSMTTISGICPFFIKQNKYSKLSPDKFERKILVPLGTSFKNYATSADFASYVSSTLVSSIRLNDPLKVFESGDASFSANHKYLISNLSWLYFLNTTGAGNLGYEPSATVQDLIVNKLYRGQSIDIDDGIKGLSEFVSKNLTTCAVHWSSLELLPADFVSSTGTYTSGTQQLDKLKTWIDIIYSPSYFDRHDFTVKNAFDTFTASAQNRSGLKTNESYAGPFYRLVRAFSFLVADNYDEIDQIETFYDIDNCPEELLPLLANLIGWKLFGYDTNRWRLQLQNAVEVYKRVGTKQSIQFAINSIFPRDVFDVSSSIYELWESYIPHLMYYAIATDSSSFDSFESWTPSIALKMNVSGYSTSSMDENIRMAVDTILLYIVRKFPELFSVAGRPFPLHDPKFRFSYRGREMPIPPWEEIPYYANADITEQLVRTIVDQLACFGVRKEFALQVGSYIRNNTLLATDQYREGNTWLIFTSSNQVPANWSNVLASISTRREEYLSLWSGKSSHFKVLFDAASFDFSKDTLEVDSAEAIYEAIRVIDEFSPAHSIPDPRLSLAQTEDYTTSSVILPVIHYDPDDTFVDYSNGKVLKNREVTGVNLVSYRRGTDLGTPLHRSDVDSVRDTKLTTSASPLITNVNRNSFRRRNYKFLLPKEGWYNRNGFNMPTSWDASTLENSMPSSMGFSPLGFVPSAQRYHPIADYRNIPAVYSICENLNSTGTYSGVDTSNTFPCRGLSALGSDAKHTQYLSRPDYYVDRGGLPKIAAIMHNLLQRKQYIEAAKLYEDTYFEEFSPSAAWRDSITSLMNSALEVSSWEPSSSLFYQYFPFGRGPHQLYKDYTTLLERHFLRPDLWPWDGPTIFGHTLNSILTNSKFYIKGVTGASFFASSVDSPSSMPYGATVGPFSNNSGQRVVYQTDVITSPTSLIVSAQASGSEFRNDKILSAVTLIMTSGISDSNEFTIFNLDGSFKRDDDDNYLILNPVIKQRSVNGLPRIRIGVRDFSHGAFSTVLSKFHPEGGTDYDSNSFNIFPVTTNFLTVDHDYEFTVKMVGGDEKGDFLGGVKLGVWIHTDTESNKFWTWMPNGEWVQQSVNDLTVDYVVNNLTHIFEYPKEDFKQPKNPPDRGQCIEFFDPNSPNRVNSVIRNLQEKHFKNFSVKFNTKNRKIKLPTDYHKSHGQLHSNSKNYIFEFFMLPDANADKFVLFDEVKLQDLTNKERAAIEVTGESTNGNPFRRFCNVSSVYFDHYELSEIFKFWNLISGDRYAQPWASRNANAAMTLLFDTSGGSRLNYRTRPEWHTLGISTDFTNWIYNITIEDY